VTLMEMQDKPDPAGAEILPVVRYAALQRRGGAWLLGSCDLLGSQ
jgi:hypothetical protein